MLLEIEKTQTVMVEVDFPLYKKHGSAMYKILSPDSFIEVDNYGNGYEQGITTRTKSAKVTGLIITDGTDIVAEDFLTAFNAEKERINSIQL